jgi:hypothetical protein
MKQPAVYILASKRNETLYIGVTGNLANRIEAHPAGKAAEEVEPSMEDPSDRGNEPRMDGSLGSDLLILGSHLRGNDGIPLSVTRHVLANGLHVAAANSRPCH